jgi:hypothetical protein
MRFHRRLDEVRTQRAFRDTELAILERYIIVIAENTVLLNSQDPVRCSPGKATKTLPFCPALIANRALCAEAKVSRNQTWASAIVEIPTTWPDADVAAFDARWPPGSRTRLALGVDLSR